MPGARTGAGATRADAPSVTPGRRYSSIQLPRGFYHLCLGWLDVFPPPGPLASSTPAASWWLTLRRMLRPLRMMPILLSGPRVWFAKFRYRWEVVVIFLLDVWAGLPGGVGSLVPAQGREGTLAAPVAGEAHDVAVMVAELFPEMLQQDFGYKPYKVLLALPEKEEPLESRNLEPERAAEMAEDEAEQPKPPSAASWPGPGLPQRQGCST